MKKTLKTVLCILLCISTLFAFTGCETAAGREAAARAAAENFLDAICKLDMQTAAACTTDSEAFLAGVEFKNAEDVKNLFTDAMLEGAGAEFSPYTEKFMPLIDIVINRLQSTFGYEITGATVDGDGYLVSGTLTHIDFDVDMEALINTDEAAMNDILARVATKVMENGQITAQTTETELIAMMIDPLVEELSPILSDALEKIPSVQEDITLKVEKKDASWLVNDAGSSIGDMDFMDIL